MTPQRKFLIFRNMELANSNIKKFLIFSQKKAFLYFGRQKHRKKSLYFRKRKFFIFQENGNPINVTFQAPKIKKIYNLEKFLIFQEMELSSS